MKFVLSTLLAAMALPALADTGASARLTGLRYELVDLDPNDGITPYVRFTGQSYAESYLGNYCGGRDPCGQTGTFTTPAAWSWSYGNGSNFGSASVSPEGLFASVRSSTIPSSPGAVGPESTRSDATNALARYQGVLGQPLFVVSANTGLRITGQYTLDAFSEPYRSPTPLLRGLESGVASVFFRSKFIDGEVPFVRLSASSDWRSEPEYAHETGEISVLMRNHLDHQATLWGKWGVQANAYVPGVPEPSTYALMLAGAAVVGWVAKRRRAPGQGA
jgi:hypothetical protein